MIFIETFSDIPKIVDFSLKKMPENKSDRCIMRHVGLVSSEQKVSRLRQKPFTLWVTGLSGAGKSTLAFAMENAFDQLGYLATVLDGDNVRHGLCQDLGFSAEDRSENIRRIAEVARLMNDAGLIVITSLISPFREDRSKAKNIIGDSNFREIHLNTDLSVCENRDVKGLYKKARSGELHEFTGVSSPYEPPLEPFVQIDTAKMGLEESVALLLHCLDLKPID